MGILDQAKPVSETDEFIKLCLYGYPGVGKTVLAASAPNPIYLDFERSTDTLRHWPEFKDTPVIRPKSMKEVDAAVKDFATSAKFETLIFDTTTRMQFFQVAEHMKGVSNRDRHLPLFQDFRKSTEYLDEIFVTLQTMEKNVIFICHVREDTNDEGRIIRIRPDLTPAVGSRLGGLLNVTAYLEFKNKKRTLLINPTNIIVAKNRLNLTTDIENPTLEKLFQGEQS